MRQMTEGSGPGPGDSVCYRGRTGPVWALVDSVTGDGQFIVRSGYVGKLVPLTPERVTRWERGGAMFYSRTGAPGFKPVVG